MAQGTVHNFDKSLALSSSIADEAFWFGLYKEIFPNLVSAVAIEAKDRWAQRAGIDRRLVMSDGSTVTVEEKVRSSVYPDFCLEYWSDRERRKPGWIAKDLDCDYIAYVFLPTRECYLLPFGLLRRAWRENYREWTRSYRKVEAKNRDFTTVSVAVPIPVVKEAIWRAMTTRYPA